MTTQDVHIRDERITDFTAISDVTVAAFETMEISNHTEQFIIEALRDAKALLIFPLFPYAFRLLTVIRNRT
jgi:putative acetyltransferase